MSKPTRKQIANLRCPDIKGLLDDVVHVLRHSIVDITRMRRSIEFTDEAIECSARAAFESWKLLKAASSTRIIFNLSSRTIVTADALCQLCSKGPLAQGVCRRQ